MNSFSISKRPPKRLARRMGSSADEPTPSPPPTVSVSTELYIMPYTHRSFVVMGDTLSHSNALTRLGGKYNPGLRIGQGWIFAKVREESVRNYIETGEIVPHVYDAKDIAKYNQDKADNTPTSATQDIGKFRKIFSELRQAFDSNEDYEGKSIIEVIYQLEEKYLPSKKTSIKAATKKTFKEPTPEPEEEAEEEAEEEEQEQEAAEEEE